MRDRIRTGRFALGAAALAAAGVMLCGCFRPGGSLMTLGQGTYVSTTWSPKTVTLIDTRTGEALWSVDVPVGQQLSYQFRTGAGPNEYKPDLMRWGLTEAGRYSGALRMQIAVPSKNARRLDVSIRPTKPESAGDPLPGSPFIEEPPPMPESSMDDEMDALGTDEWDDGMGEDTVIVPADPEPAPPPASDDPFETLEPWDEWDN